MTEFQTPPNPAHFIRCDGRLYDLHALETPFGLLPEPVQEALKEQPRGGVEQYTTCGWRNHAMHRVSYHSCVVYRAKPAPVVKSYNLHWKVGGCAMPKLHPIDTHRITITGPDGGPYTATVEALE